MRSSDAGISALLSSGPVTRGLRKGSSVETGPKGLTFALRSCGLFSCGLAPKTRPLCCAGSKMQLPLTGPNSVVV